MKNHKIIALLSICLCMVLCSCESIRAGSLRLYEVYVCDESTTMVFDDDPGDVRYNKADNIYTMPRKKTTVKKGESDKQLQLGAETITLKYDCTYNKDYCEYNVSSYSDDEYKIKASFRTDDGSLDYIRLGNYKYRVFDGMIDTETKLMDICTNYLSEYVDELDRYNSSIITKAWIVNDRGSGIESTDGYVSPSEYNDASSVSYQVDFTYYIGGIKTPDIISMLIDSNGYLETLSLNMIGAFEPFAKCEIDVKKCDQLINSELTKLCDVENYKYTGYEDERILLIIKNKLCLLSFAEPTFEPKDGRDVLAKDIQILIPIAKR